MPIHQTKYGGLKRRSNYEEELDYLLYHQEHMIYPDRAASQMLKSPYMTQFHSEHFNIMSEQDKKRNEKIEADARLKITTASSGASGGGIIPAMAAQGAPPSGGAPPTYAMNSPRGSNASITSSMYRIYNALQEEEDFTRTIREDVQDMRADTIQHREQLDIPAFQQTPVHLQPSSTPASYIPNIRPSLAQLQPSSVSGSYIRPFQPSTMRSQIPPNMQIEHSNIQMSMGAAVIAQEAASSSAMAAGFVPPIPKRGRGDEPEDIEPEPESIPYANLKTVDEFMAFTNSRDDRLTSTSQISDIFNGLKKKDLVGYNDAFATMRQQTGLQEFIDKYPNFKKSVAKTPSMDERKYVLWIYAQKKR